MQVMNSLAFQESTQAKKLDANFISVYNTEKKEFEYYVQRMLGVHISNEGQPARGRIWVPYVNAQREDWSFICENNRVVSPDDEIVFRYEQHFSHHKARDGGPALL
jgi:hypothetical protein